MAVAEMWETLKQAIVAYTGLSPPAFFTAVAVAAALYHVVSGIFAAPPPPPPRPRDEPEAEPLPPPVQLGEVSEEELRQYNGSDPKKPLLMAIKGQIYDVTQSRMFYGPGGPYALFAGKDASRALAKMSFEPQDLTSDISGLGPFELDALQDWEYKFMGKYVKVGTIKKTAPAEDGNTNTSPETTENAAAAEPDKAPATEVKPREVSSEEVKEKEEVAAAAAPAPDEVAKES
ncbi:membrane steroid-binding protein 1 [Oryza brachyantha]|uniref:membrane steroid-binding protein 1 n=1 Tax=Oryza brachyantha TaxID=4533 RepID=UPI001ADD33E0|nr:membrane steroid-binding protein 1 [Oryza brachyantha]